MTEATMSTRDAPCLVPFCHLPAPIFGPAGSRLTISPASPATSLSSYVHRLQISRVTPFFLSEFLDQRMLAVHQSSILCSSDQRKQTNSYQSHCELTEYKTFRPCSMVSSGVSLVPWNSEFVSKHMRTPRLTQAHYGREVVPSREPTGAHFQHTCPQCGFLH